MSALITHLKNKQLVWQASQQAQTAAAKIATGVAELDQALNGGFPKQGVVRINSAMGIGELKLCMPIIQQRQQDKRQLFVMAPPVQINAEMLIAHDVAIEQVFFVASDNTANKLWACEQCLKSGLCHTVLLWQSKLSLTQAKRLQVAAEQGDCLLLLFEYNSVAQPLPISLSMNLSREQDALHINIAKQRGGWPVTDLTVKHTLNSIRQRYQTVAQPHTKNNIIALHAQR